MAMSWLNQRPNPWNRQSNLGLGIGDFMNWLFPGGTSGREQLTANTTANRARLLREGMAQQGRGTGVYQGPMVQGTSPTNQGATTSDGITSGLAGSPGMPFYTNNGIPYSPAGVAMNPSAVNPNVASPPVGLSGSPTASQPRQPTFYDGSGMAVDIYGRPVNTFGNIVAQGATGNANSRENQARWNNPNTGPGRGQIFGDTFNASGQRKPSIGALNRLAGEVRVLTSRTAR